MNDLKKIEDIVMVFSNIFNYLENNPDVLSEIFKDESKISEKKQDKKCTSDKSVSEDSIDGNIYEIYRKQGKDNLESLLKQRSIDELKSIVKKHRLDPKKYFYNWKTKEKFVSFILEKVESKAEKGKVFLTEEIEDEKN